MAEKSESPVPLASARSLPTKEVDQEERGPSVVCTPGLRWPFGIVLTLVTAICVAAGFYWFSDRLFRLEHESTQRFSEIGMRLTHLGSAVQKSENQLQDVQNRLGVLEGKVADTEGLEAQLERFSRNLASDTSDALLSEAESTLALASQQLALGNSSSVILEVLQRVEDRLGATNDPSLNSVRRALLRDIDRLKVSPTVDFVSLAGQMDDLLADIDQMLMVSSAFASTQVSPVRSDQSIHAKNSDKKSIRGSLETHSQGVPAWLSDGFSAVLAGAREAFLPLFRVSRVDLPDAALLAPDQAYFVRENLRLTLLNARLSLLTRNESLFHHDVNRSIRWLSAYYDSTDKRVAQALAKLRQLYSTPIAFSSPDLADSLRELRLLREGRRSAAGQPLS